MLVLDKDCFELNFTLFEKYRNNSQNISVIKELNKIIIKLNNFFFLYYLSF